MCADRNPRYRNRAEQVSADVHDLGATIVKCVARGIRTVDDVAPMQLFVVNARHHAG